LEHQHTCKKFANVEYMRQGINLHVFGRLAVFQVFCVFVTANTA